MTVRTRTLPTATATTTPHSTIPTAAGPFTVVGGVFACVSVCVCVRACRCNDVTRPILPPRLGLLLLSSPPHNTNDDDDDDDTHNNDE
jgi:hypothetical protein